MNRPTTMDMERFARERVRGRGLAGSDAFPHDLWQDMAARGLFRIGLPVEYGGDGGGYAEIAAADRTLARYGGCLGFAMSWTGHRMIARHFLLAFGDDAQKARHLSASTGGSGTTAVAISEPGVGAHPRDLQTRARREGEDWVLDGEKAWITNGPIADLFVVVAIVAVDAGRKRFGAFLVPRSTPGLTLPEMPALGALRPSPHCRLRLQACRVPASAVLGPLGTAYESMALPFRDVEDAVGVSSSAGLARFIVEGLAAAAGRAAATDILAVLGEIAGITAVLEIVADRLAMDLDRPAIDKTVGPDVLIGARASIQQLVGRIEHARALIAPLDAELVAACKDLSFTLDIARGPRAMKQARLGAAIVAAAGTG